MHAGGGIITAMMSEVTSQLQAKFCKHAELAKQKKMLSVIALSVNQEINKTETLSHGISKVTIVQKWKFNKTGTSPHGISRFADSAKAGNSTKLEFTTWHL